MHAEHTFIKVKRGREAGGSHLTAAESHSDRASRTAVPTEGCSTCAPLPGALPLPGPKGAWPPGKDSSTS